MPAELLMALFLLPHMLFSLGTGLHVLLTLPNRLELMTHIVFTVNHGGHSRERVFIEMTG
jgi:hypothetical protein